MKDKTFEQDIYDIAAIGFPQLDAIEKDCKRFTKEQLDEITFEESLDYPRLVYPSSLEGEGGLVCNYEEVFCFIIESEKLKIAYSRPGWGSVNIGYNHIYSLFDNIMILVLNSIINEEDFERFQIH